jgi:hypothetical protein
MHISESQGSAASAGVKATNRITASSRKTISASFGHLDSIGISFGNQVQRISRNTNHSNCSWLALYALSDKYVNEL